MIYSEHIAECNAYSQASPDGLARAVRFVLATIQQQLETVPRMVTEFESMGSQSRYAWGMKRAGLDWLEIHAETLYKIAMANRGHDRELLATFLAVPGLGLVKAGFACQLFNNQVGCIDTHNIKLYGIPLSAVKYNYSLKPETLIAKQQTYVDLCHGLGGSAALWSRWCDYVATVRPHNWDSGYAVSQFHADVITARETGAIVDLFTDISETPRFAA